MARPKTITGELTPVQIRILPSLKESLTDRAAAFSKSFNTHVAEVLQESFMHAVPADAPTTTLQSADIEQAYRYGAELWKVVAPQCETLPDLVGLMTQFDNYLTSFRRPWYGILETIKNLPKLQQGRVFSALVRESSGAKCLQLPDGFRDMTQADKASWLDTNCPLGGAA